MSQDDSNHGGMLAFLITFSLTIVFFVFVYMVQMEPLDTKQWEWGPTFSKAETQKRLEQWKTPSPENIDYGKQIYAINCVFCHGGSSINEDPILHRIQTGQLKWGDSFYEIMMKGIPEAQKPKMDFISEKARWAVVHYLNSMKGSSGQ